MKKGRKGRNKRATAVVSGPTLRDTSVGTKLPYQTYGPSYPSTIVKTGEGIMPQSLVNKYNLPTNQYVSLKSERVPQPMSPSEYKSIIEYQNMMKSPTKIPSPQMPSSQMVKAITDYMATRPPSLPTTPTQPAKTISSPGKLTMQKGKRKTKRGKRHAKRSL
jgi:hypothetical protein